MNLTVSVISTYGKARLNQHPIKRGNSTITVLNSLHAPINIYYYYDILVVITLFSVDGVNNYVNVTFDHVTETITCVFLTEPLDSMKECDVILSYGVKCNKVLDVYEVSGRESTLETPPLGFIEGADQYCYEVIARHQNLNLNITVEGIINLQHSSDTQQQQNGVVVYLLSAGDLHYVLCMQVHAMQ